MCFPIASDDRWRIEAYHRAAQQRARAEALRAQAEANVAHQDVGDVIDGEYEVVERPLFLPAPVTDATSESGL